MADLIKVSHNGTGGLEVGNSVSKKRILVVDDSKPLRNMLALMLGNGGYEVEISSDGEEALKILRQEGLPPYDLMITDLNMEFMSGFELIEILHREEVPCPPIMVCSVNCDVGTIQRISRLGVRHYIRKPFLTETVLNKVADVFLDESGTEVN